jgi:mono/diheme cytochrome c family protein
MKWIAFLIAGTTLLATSLGHAHDGEGHDSAQPVPVVRGIPKKPTYHKHVEKIFRSNCTTCHHDGDIAPMSLDTYEGASSWMVQALEEIAHGRMPPWQPSRGVGSFEGERHLSDRDWATLAR